jgi:WD40-like Beta Propeller Repeat
MQKRTRRVDWRRLLLLGGATALLGVIVAATSGDEQKFSAWSTPVNLGTLVNSPFYDACPTISKNGLSLYFRSNRPGFQGSQANFDIWVAQRDSLEDLWKAPVNLGPTINSEYHEFCTTFSPDGHWMVFVTMRPLSAGGCGGQDLWISHRQNKRDDLGWETPRSLGCIVNSAAPENGPAWFEDEATGRTLLYYSSGRPGGPGALDIYVTETVNDQKDNFGPPSLVAELSTSYADYQPVLSRDGLELFFASDRPGSLAASCPPVCSPPYPPGTLSVDIWVTQRDTVEGPWSPPVNLGSEVNSTYWDFHPTLSFDKTTLIFASERGGAAVGWGDLWVSTRTNLRGRE